MRYELRDFGIEITADDRGCVYLSDPARYFANEPFDKEHVPFRMPIAAENGEVLGELIFEYRATFNGKRIFQAVRMRQADCQTPHQEALWLDVLGLRWEVGTHGSEECSFGFPKDYLPY